MPLQKKKKASEIAAEALAAGKARVIGQPKPALAKAEAPKPEKGDEKPSK